jgi:alkaline phosphatase D
MRGHAQQDRAPCDFKKMVRQAGGVAPSAPIASVKRVRVAAGVTDVTVV